MHALLLHDTLSALLSPAQDCRVHSVFKHAYKRQTSRQKLLTLQAQTIFMSPSPSGWPLPCDTLQTLFIQSAKLTVYIKQNTNAPSCSILRADTKRCCLYLSYSSDLTHIKSISLILRIFLLITSPADCMLALPLWQLLGLSISPTLSTDGFLLGILLIMDAVHKPLRDDFADVRNPLLSLITDISATIPCHGCSGRYDAQFFIFMVCPTTHIPAALIHIVNYGHSAGHDTLYKMAFALECLIKPGPHS